MTYADVTRAKGGDSFLFDYAHADVADAFIMREGDWGLYTADNVSVTDAVRPEEDDDGESLPGSYRVSISLLHLQAFSSAHVDWEGSGFTVEYTLDGESWTAIADNGAIALAGDPDFDLRFTFAGGIADDPAELTKLVVYVMRTDALSIQGGNRTLSTSADTMRNGILTIDAPVTASELSENVSTLQPVDGTVSGAPSRLTGTVEMYIKPGSTTPISGPAGTFYVNGVAATPTAGSWQHVVFTLNSPSNATFTIAGNAEIAHLAFYRNKMSANEVLALYKAQTGKNILTFADAAQITVTEGTPAVDMYAYTWSIVSGSS